MQNSAEGFTAGQSVTSGFARAAPATSSAAEEAAQAGSATAPISLGDKLAYGIGSVPYAAKEAAFGTFVLLFYTQVLGLSGSLTGLAIFLSVIWDAVSDPLVGAWSDRLRTRWGRRHPVMLLGTAPLALSFLMLFSPPAAIAGDQGLLFAWLLASVLLLRTSLTVFYIPQNAMGAEISANYEERSSIVNYRTNLSWIAGVAVPAVWLTLLFVPEGDTDGRFVAANYRAFGWACLALSLTACLLCIAGTWKFIPRLQAVAARSTESPGLRGMLADTLATLKNANFRRIFIFEIAVGGTLGILGALQMITFTYFWELSIAQISLLALSSLLAVAVAFPGMALLSQRWQKQSLLRLAVAGLALNTLWLIPGRLFGLLPENGTTALFALVFLNALITTVFTIMRTVTLHSIMADIADEHELATGRRQEGVFFAATTFALKFVMGFGYMVAGPLLDAVGLNAGVAPGEASDAALLGIGITVGPVMTLLLLVPWWMANRIDVSRERLQEVQAALASRDR
ncbi:MFS transporter [Parahaliea aestuarii]|uniref:Sugar transporter n=1 Tax=Parahaliea aestuarii TaxID=1852021 RepID=A0A5C9A4X3_9GAMM|nr:MFS transporter [Parahaliea aestuarii]TXS94687.1 sugar transporter [Parahaliea aestuarii]